MQTEQDEVHDVDQCKEEEIGQFVGVVKDTNRAIKGQPRRFWYIHCRDIQSKFGQKAVYPKRWPTWATSDAKRRQQVKFTAMLQENGRLVATNVIFLEATIEADVNTVAPTKSLKDIPTKRRKKKIVSEETMIKRVAARQKQINIAKASLEYARYIEAVPLDRRSASDPQTPDPNERIGLKKFDRKRATWRRAMHKRECERLPCAFFHMGKCDKGRECKFCHRCDWTDGDESCRDVSQLDTEEIWKSWRQGNARRRTNRYLTTKIQNCFATQANRNANSDEEYESAEELSESHSETGEVQGLCEWVTDSDSGKDPMPLTIDQMTHVEFREDAGSLSSGVGAQCMLLPVDGLPVRQQQCDVSDSEMWEACPTFTMIQPLQVEPWRELGNDVQPFDTDWKQVEAEEALQLFLWTSDGIDPPDKATQDETMTYCDGCGIYLEWANVIWSLDQWLCSKCANEVMFKAEQWSSELPAKPTTMHVDPNESHEWQKKNMTWNGDCMIDESSLVFVLDEPDLKDKLKSSVKQGSVKANAKMLRRIHQYGKEYQQSNHYWHASSTSSSTSASSMTTERSSVTPSLERVTPETPPPFIFSADGNAVPLGAPISLGPTALSSARQLDVIAQRSSQGSGRPNMVDDSPRVFAGSTGVPAAVPKPKPVAKPMPPPLPVIPEEPVTQTLHGRAQAHAQRLVSVQDDQPIGYPPTRMVFHTERTTGYTTDRRFVHVEYMDNGTRINLRWTYSPHVLRTVARRGDLAHEDYDIQPWIDLEDLQRSEARTVPAALVNYVRDAMGYPWGYHVDMTQNLIDTHPFDLDCYYDVFRGVNGRVPTIEDLNRLFPVLYDISAQAAEFLISRVDHSIKCLQAMAKMKQNAWPYRRYNYDYLARLRHLHGHTGHHTTFGSNEVPLLPLAADQSLLGLTCCNPFKAMQVQFVKATLEKPQTYPIPYYPQERIPTFTDLMIRMAQPQADQITNEQVISASQWCARAMAWLLDGEYLTRATEGEDPLMKQEVMMFIDMVQIGCMSWEQLEIEMGAIAKAAMGLGQHNAIVFNPVSIGVFRTMIIMYNYLPTLFSAEWRKDYMNMLWNARHMPRIAANLTLPLQDDAAAYHGIEREGHGNTRQFMELLEAINPEDGREKCLWTSILYRRYVRPWERVLDDERHRPFAIRWRDQITLDDGSRQLILLPHINILLIYMTGQDDTISRQPSSDYLPELAWLDGSIDENPVVSRAVRRRFINPTDWDDVEDPRDITRYRSAEQEAQWLENRRVMRPRWGNQTAISRLRSVELQALVQRIVENAHAGGRFIRRFGIADEYHSTKPLIVRKVLYGQIPLEIFPYGQTPDGEVIVIHSVEPFCIECHSPLRRSLTSNLIDSRMFAPGVSEFDWRNLSPREEGEEHHDWTKKVLARRQLNYGVKACRQCACLIHSECKPAHDAEVHDPDVCASICQAYGIARGPHAQRGSKCHICAQPSSVRPLYPQCFKMHSHEEKFEDLRSNHFLNPMDRNVPWIAERHFNHQWVAPGQRCVIPVEHRYENDMINPLYFGNSKDEVKFRQLSMEVHIIIRSFLDYPPAVAVPVHNTRAGSDESTDQTNPTNDFDLIKCYPKVWRDEWYQFSDSSGPREIIGGCPRQPSDAYNDVDKNPFRRTDGNVAQWCVCGNVIPLPENVRWCRCERHTLPFHEECLADHYIKEGILGNRREDVSDLFHVNPRNEVRRRAELKAIKARDTAKKPSEVFLMLEHRYAQFYKGVREFEYDPTYTVKRWDNLRRWTEERTRMDGEFGDAERAHGRHFNRLQWIMSWKRFMWRLVIQWRLEEMGYYGANAIKKWMDAIKMFVATMILRRDRDFTDDAEGYHEPYNIIWTSVDPLVEGDSPDILLPLPKHRDYVAWYVPPTGPNKGTVVPFEITQPTMPCRVRTIKFWNEKDCTYQFYVDSSEVAKYEEHSRDRWEYIINYPEGDRFHNPRYPDGIQAYTPMKTYCGEWL